MSNKLLQEEALAWSTVVANNRMNRERAAKGINSYEKALRFDPIAFLEKRRTPPTCDWIDLCCGSGNALIQTVQYFQDKGLEENYSLTGIDLVDFFATHQVNRHLQLKTLNLCHWTPELQYDLITIVHGLHYIGDKIGLIAKAITSLKKDGFFIANLDLNNIIIKDQQDSANFLKAYFKENNLDYNTRTKILSTTGTQHLIPKLSYLGADDQAGPNYTGQSAVNSFYSNLT